MLSKERVYFMLRKTTWCIRMRLLHKEKCILSGDKLFRSRCTLNKKIRKRKRRNFIILLVIRSAIDSCFSRTFMDLRWRGNSQTRSKFERFDIQPTVATDESKTIDTSQCCQVSNKLPLGRTGNRIEHPIQWRTCAIKEGYSPSDLKMEMWPC